MSRAFVKEPDGGEVEPDLPHRSISPHPNFVTAKGLALMDAEIARLRSELATTTQDTDDKRAAAPLARDLRYWMARRGSAELVAPQTGPDVRFGSTVTIERADGRKQTFRITGEDEANPAAGTLSYVSPLARALIGRKVGDEITFQDDEILLLHLDQAREG